MLKYDRIFADATHLNSISRAKVINKLKQLPEEINVIWLDTPLEECIKRNNCREGRAKVPEQVIKNMYSNMCPPINTEKINYLYIVKPDNSIKIIKGGVKYG